MHCIESALGMHDQIAHFTRRAAATGVHRMPMSLLENQGMCIRHRYREPYLRHDSEVYHVIAHIGSLACGQIQIGDELLEYRQLGCVALVYVGDTQRCHAFGYELRAPPGDDCKLDAGSTEHLHAVSVTRMEGLVFDTIVAQKLPPIREHAIHIEYSELHVGGPGQHFGRGIDQSNHPCSQ
jgi:hypothetical protein